MFKIHKSREREGGGGGLVNAMGARIFAWVIKKKESANGVAARFGAAVATATSTSVCG